MTTTSILLANIIEREKLHYIIKIIEIKALILKSLQLLLKSSLLLIYIFSVINAVVFFPFFLLFVCCSSDRKERKGTSLRCDVVRVYFHSGPRPRPPRASWIFVPTTFQRSTTFYFSSVLMFSVDCCCR